MKRELGDRSGHASTRVNLGRCLSIHGQHDRAVACLKQAWAVFQELSDVRKKTLAAMHLGEACGRKREPSTTRPLLTPPPAAEVSQ